MVKIDMEKLTKATLGDMVSATGNVLNLIQSDLDMALHHEEGVKDGQLRGLLTREIESSEEKLENIDKVITSLT